MYFLVWCNSLSKFCEHWSEIISGGSFRVFFFWFSYQFWARIFNEYRDKTHVNWKPIKVSFTFPIVFPRESICFQLVRLPALFVSYIRWVSVVEFHDPTLGIGKVFGQESTVVKWNYQISGLHPVAVCQKVPILDFQSEFSMSKIIWIFRKKNSLKNISLGAPFL